MKDRSLIERLARHLAGPQPDSWPARVEDAASILAILKEPDGAMRAAGDAAGWRAMIDTALRGRWSLPQQSGGESADGADEEGEFSLSPQAVGDDSADWVHLHHGQEKGS
ncbi:hypothetical protein [Sphingobium sp. CAP-1]|uniref:hypothetical protein n=1 Tax=Sphingobium sp. CAP-1 TaxID=2676077 RepID=UPI0012BB1FAF|nr:hypothetical protein [Sphingobium sp. CAP-1]QGP78626.1 hypothetical protein GL174_06230 [Sphingobium sp. CAP-1]